MENKKKKIFLVVGVLLLVIGISFGYFIIRNIFEGQGSEINATTEVAIEGSTITVEGGIDSGSVEIMPGRMFSTKVKVTATGLNQYLMYDLVWTGNDTYGANGNGLNKLSVPLNYKIYNAADDSIAPDIECYENQKNVAGGIAVNEQCKVVNEDEFRFVSSGVIPQGESTITIAEAEEIISGRYGVVAYYYVVIEYPDNGLDQTDSDSNVTSAISGIITAKAAAGEGQLVLRNAKDTILENMDEIIDTRVSYNEFLTETTNGVIYEENIGDGTIAKVNSTTPKFTLLANEAQTSKGTTYYFAGAPTDNYVKFAGFYWRIMRINENGSIRMIYAGDAKVIDDLGSEKRKEVLSNGYDDSQTQYTQLSQKGWWSTSDYSYASSDMYYYLEDFYRKKLLTYDEYIDRESGFCNDITFSQEYGQCDEDLDMNPDRNSSKDDCDAIRGRWYKLYTNVAARLFLDSDSPNPSFECSAGGLYTPGNGRLTYPIGLITADEAVYAKGHGTGVNVHDYLYTGNDYHTMSLYMNSGYDDLTYYIYVGGKVVAASHLDLGIRPVINLKSDVLFEGEGTIDSPYTVVA